MTHRLFSLSLLALLAVPAIARAEASSDDKFAAEVQQAIDSGMITGEEALRYKFYKLMAAANAAGNTDDRLPKLDITISGNQIGGLQDLRYSAIMPDSGGSNGIVTTGDRRDMFIHPWPKRLVDEPQKVEIEVPSVPASVCTMQYYRRGQAPFLSPYRCDERKPLIVWMEFGYVTTLYFFSQDVMNACDSPEQEFPLDLRAFEILGTRTGTDIVAKAKIRCEKSKKKAHILIQTDPAWGR